MDLRRLGTAALPIVAVLALVATVLAILALAGSTLGYDYQAYVGAARRALDGAPLYDPASGPGRGGFASFLYPPPFALVFVPFALLPDQFGLWLWEGLAMASFLAGVALLPVRAPVRWAVVLLGALDWPLLFALKLGQVGPLLFLLFAMGWRWRDRATPLGLSMATGSLIKVQPLLLLAWMGLTGRWRAVAIAVGALVVASLVAAVAFGPGVWSEYVALLGRVSSPVTTPHNSTPGAVAYQLGLPEGVASVIQIASTVGVLAIFLSAIRWSTAEASYLVSVVASQLVSPIIWGHYPMLLLLPVAYLLSAGRWWAVAIPLVTAWPLIGLTPPVVYPVVFWVTMVATFVVGRTARAEGMTVLGEAVAA